MSKLMLTPPTKAPLIHSLVVALLGFAAIAQGADPPITGELHVISSNTGPTHPAGGLDINAYLGADHFYNQGYTGSRAIQANIEGQLSWSGHETLAHLQTTVVGTGALGSVGSHATAVGQAMGGRPAGDALHPGIAPNATLWSGAIGISVSGNNFSLSNASLASTYSAILKTGVGGQTADVFNSSWGFNDPTGNNFAAVGVDGLLYDTGKVGVASAGNTGPNSNTVGGIAAGYNTIAVAALGSDSDATPYNYASGFSSRSPNAYYNPNSGQTITGVRARVDIAAPGQNLTLASTASSTAHVSNQTGTSFSAPLVAGGASLLVDAGKEVYAADANAIDGRVIKAVLLNSADKTQGWNNGQAVVGGVISTTQSLDYAVGAGRMNLDTAYDQYVNSAHGGEAGTADVSGHNCFSSGSCDMGAVAATGWDYGWSNQGGSDNYFISSRLHGGSLFTATLDWFANMYSGSDANFSGTAFRHLANLDLTIFEYDPLTHAILDTVAESTSQYNVVEHLSFLLPSDGYYGLSVEYTGDLFNFNSATGEIFGLAWAGDAITPDATTLWSAGEANVPEPATLSLVLIGLAGIYARRIK